MKIDQRLRLTLQLSQFWNFPDGIRVHDSPTLSINIFFVPVATAAVSAFVLVVQTAIVVWRQRSRRALANAEAMLLHSSRLGALILQHGGSVFFLHSVTRFLGILLLFGLTVHSRGLSQQHLQETGLSFVEPLYLSSRLGVLATYAYAAVLALLALVFPFRPVKSVSKHLNVVLLSILAVYVYRDLFPLITYSRPILDIEEGPLLWAKITVLTLISVIGPLLIPRRYVPVDPKNPITPNAEQTASWLSLALYSFVDSIIFSTYRSSRLSDDQLPLLADYDEAKNLKTRFFPSLDPLRVGKKRHMIFGFMRVFGSEYIVMAVMIFGHISLAFASPIGIQQLLRYLETGGKDATIRPWFWILWLFIGPFCSSIAWQFYFYISTHVIVRAEAIVTQLVFEHSLRIRMKAEKSEESRSISRESSFSSTLDEPDELCFLSGNEAGHTDVQESSDSLEVDTLQSQEHTLQGSSSSVKSGASGKRKVSEDSEQAEAEKRSSSNLAGKINNLVTSDLDNITDGRDILILVIMIPLQIIACITFLYYILGWSAFVGLATILLLSPIPGYIAKLAQDIQVNRAKATDARVQEVTETMSMLRMVKFFGWEKKMMDRLSEKRDQELAWMWKRQLLQVHNGNVKRLPHSYSNDGRDICNITVVMKQELSASIVFSSMAVFEMLERQLHMSSSVITRCVTANVSLKRLGDFLHDTELLDSFSGKDAILHLGNTSIKEDDRIGFCDATFVWSSRSDGSVTPSEHRFVLRIGGELLFNRGCLNLIIGPTGSGKTSLLMALLGEMHCLPSGPSSWFNLPRNEGVAYAAQESWVLNDTIKNNILFGAPLDEARYKKVLHQCSLERDLELFDAGDQTEVGEKGLTLSGGQKARVTLARAVYSSASILLLDDVLAALDVHTANWIVSKCFAGDLLQGRTVLLITHNIAMVHPISEFVVSMGFDGSVAAAGLTSDPRIKAILPCHESHVEEEPATGDQDSSTATTNKTASDGKLILAEDVDEGHVSWSAFKLYLRGLGGNHLALFFTLCISSLLSAALINAFQTWYLGYWASQYENQDPSTVPVVYYLTVYTTIVFSGVFFYCLAFIAYLFGAMRASRSIHKQLIEAIMGTTLRWLDVTPVSRVITRCTRDIRTIDTEVAFELMDLCELTLHMFVRLGAIVILTPAFLLPGVLVAVAGGWCGQIYMAAQLPIKRQMSNAKAPVLGHFGAAIAGLTSIRAYGAQEPFEAESLRRINRYTRSARTFWNLNRWISIRIDAMGGLFAAALATYLVYFKDPTAANTGFSLNMAVSFSSMILWWVRILNDFEVKANSLERVQGYLEIEQEPKPHKAGVPPAYWPASGDLRVEHLSARYSQTGPKVLRDISFHVRSGERIGVVGRTGSGKSSLTLALLRCIITEGSIYYDGLDTGKINLDALRSNVTIIPQVPELISGSLRHNLDPFDQHDDATLNDALRAAGLFSLPTELDEGRITLDTSISSGGGNLSVGQKQIIALARAMVRGSKLFILDEATSAIDYKTDTVIQSSIRHELPKDVTIIAIAHRLQTIMDYDKIMVLDAGQILEFDAPRELLKRSSGKFRSLVDESGDKDLLYAIANGTGSI